MPVNIRLLKKVRKLIAEEPRRLRMSGWGVRYSKDESETNYIPNLPPCRTVCCLAGNILLAHAATEDAKEKLFDRDGLMRQTFGKTFISQRAAKLIGVKPQDCPFWKFGWKAPEVLAWIDRQIDAASK